MQHSRRPEAVPLASAALAVAAAAASAAPEHPPAVVFVDEAESAGLVVGIGGNASEISSIAETTGAGACLLDFDLDEDVDLYIVGGEPPGRRSETHRAASALFENLGDGRFLEVGARAGVSDSGWGGGCTVGDYDNDGDPDLFVTNLGPNVLFRNNGDGTFADVSRVAGLDDPRWSTGAVFVDVDLDGDLDLYVANYLRLDDTAAGRNCAWKGAPVICGPRGFEAVPDALLINDGTGRFRDESAERGVSGFELYSLGVVAGDVDRDGDPDLVVANDSQENLLFLNDGGGRFTEAGLVAGIALSGDGRQQAGMGVDLADYDEDGDQDLFVTNFSDDYHTLYRNEGETLFTDVSLPAGLDPVTRASLGWGGGFLDYDNDGHLDLFVAGGHVYPEVDEHDPLTSYRQSNLLLRGDGEGRFTDVSRTSGPGMDLVQGSRGAAFGDYDDDGDLDILVVNIDDRPALLRNDGGNARNWFKVRLIGRKSNRDALGATVRLTAGGRTQFRESRLTSGYYSSHDPRIHFGIGSATHVERLEIAWPSGERQTHLDLPANRLATLDEIEGLVGLAPARGSPSDRRQALPLRSTPPIASAPESHPRPSPGTARLSTESLRRIDLLLKTGTQHILGGRYTVAIANYRSALTELPSASAAENSVDALGFGSIDGYRSFLASVWDNLGVALMRAERLTECSDAIRQAIDLAPNRAKLHHNLGLCHFHGRRYGEAIDALEAARAADPEREGIAYDLGRPMALSGSCDSAVDELLLALRRLPRPDLRGRRAEVWYYLGDCYAREGRHMEAARSLRESLAIVPGHQKALYRLERALRGAGLVEEADRVQALFRARQPADEAVRARQRAGVDSAAERLSIARELARVGLWPQAMREARMTLALEPDNADAHALMGDLLLRLRQPRLEAAETAYREALDLAPDHPAALVGLGETLRRRGLPERATTAFQRALAALPDRIETMPLRFEGMLGLARLAADRGETETATALARNLTSLADSFDARVGVAQLLIEIAESTGSGAEQALALLGEAEPLYGEGLDAEVRALVLMGRDTEARQLIRSSPFLGATDRLRLDQLVGAEPPGGPS